MKKWLVLGVCMMAMCLLLTEAKKIHVHEEPTANSNYQIGTGIYDITGPPGGVGMMGYAMMNQVTAGLHYRLRARAFVFVDPVSNKRIAFVSTDSCMIFTSVKNKVVESLQYLYGDLYTQDNVVLSGTHTHSGPAGYAYYAMYNLMSWGFHPNNFNTIVNGIVKAISMAHNDISKGGRILINSGELLESNINRSPSAYLANPSSERAKYAYNVDKLMTLLRMEDESQNPIGMLNWFAVHGTSMNNTNELISGDNKGYASYIFEKYMNGNSSLPGFGPFVAAFGQTNEGDVSPNTKGAFCEDGTPCEFATSTCGGYSQGCHGYGPGSDDFESTKIIGTNQFNKALELFKTATIELSGPIDYIHTFVNMENVTVDAKWTSTGETGYTCTGGLGDSFAGGTTDGPGDFDFTQGTNSTSVNPYWNFLAEFIADPSEADRQCQAPKPILLFTGGADFPCPWTPAILPLQIVRIGQLFIIAVPGEFSTMSGRRLRDSVRATLEQYGAADNNSFVVIAGLANAYSHYITTYEEYSFQRYEGASTLYGPHTLAAYQQEYSNLAAAMAQGKSVPPGPTPPDLSSKTFSFEPPAVPDEPPLFGKFGDLYQDVDSKYEVNTTVTVIFYGGQPNNDFRTQSTYLTVERQVNGQWQVVLTDGDWDTKFYWRRHDLLEDLITITWDISLDTVPGTYRIQHFGSSRDLFGTITPYQGTSSSFTVTA